MFKSLLLLTLLLAGTLVHASTCINLGDYNLTPAGNYSASEQSDFKAKKFEVYRSFVLNENKLTNFYSIQLQNLYETENSDTELASKVKALQDKKNKALSNNCNNHKKKLKDLLNLF